MSPAAHRDRLRALAPIAIFDVGGPLIVYYSLRSAGLSTVAALILSGLPPAAGVARAAVLRRRLDAIGALVLTGIVVGAVVGLASDSARLVLLDATVPAAVFGLVCLGSLWSRRPLIYRFALEGIGADTAKGRGFAERWRHRGFRHAFRVATAVWGLAFLAQAGVQVVIIQTASIATAKVSANALPLAVLGLLAGWNTWYALRGQRAARRPDAAASGSVPPVRQPRPGTPP